MSKTKHEALVFLVVGSITVFIDFVVYRLTVGLEFLEPSVAKTVSFLVGMIFAFVANKKFTFQSQSPSKEEIFPFLCTYALSLVVNIFVHSQVFKYYTFAFKHEVAFLMATGASTVMNFLGMKFLVFRAPLEQNLNQDTQKGREG